METLLKFNPNKRLTAHAALRHPYVQRFLSLIIIKILITTMMTMVIMTNHDHDHQNGYHDDDDNDFYQVSQQFPRAGDEARCDSTPFRFILTQKYHLQGQAYIIYITIIIITSIIIIIIIIIISTLVIIIIFSRLCPAQRGAISG